MPLSHNVKQFLTNDDTSDQKSFVCFNYLSLFEKRCWHSLIRGGFLFKKLLLLLLEPKSMEMENHLLENSFGNFSTVLNKNWNNLARPFATPFHLTWMKYRFLPDLFNRLVPLATRIVFTSFFFSFSSFSSSVWINSQSSMS